MTQHDDHDTVAVDRAPRRAAGPPAQREAAGALAVPDGGQSGVVRSSDVPPWRAGGRSADVGGMPTIYTILVYLPTVIY